MNRRGKLLRPPDKRRRTDLDVFVLALIEAGVSTPYELQRSAQLSQGATGPVLERLLASRLVLAGQPGPRNRVGYRISAAGKRYIAAEWRTLVEAGPTGDLDVDLRVALLSLWLGGKSGEAAKFLSDCANLRATARQIHGGTDLPKDVPLLAAWYTDLRAISSQKRAEADLEVIAAVLQALPRTRPPHAKPGG